MDILDTIIEFVRQHPSGVVGFIIASIILCLSCKVVGFGTRKVTGNIKSQTPKKHWWTGKKPVEIAQIYLGTLGCIVVTGIVIIIAVMAIRGIYLKW